MSWPVVYVAVCFVAFIIHPSCRWRARVRGVLLAREAKGKVMDVWDIISIKVGALGLMLGFAGHYGLAAACACVCLWTAVRSGR